MDRFAVFGCPIAHSLSPIIHQVFAKQTQNTITYEKFLTRQGELRQMLQAFRKQGARGANITLPLKIEAFELCQCLTPSAQDAFAVNTIYWKKNILWGDNTDGAGCVGFLKESLNLNLQDKRILILGAGGATRGILPSLLNLSVQQIVVVNRSPEKASLVSHPSVKMYSYEAFTQAKEPSFDLIINATSLSLQAELAPIDPKWVKGAIVMDLVYLPAQKTIFQQWALSHGAKQAHDGLGMLVWQAAYSFQIWHHQFPDPHAVIQQLQDSQH